MRLRRSAPYGHGVRRVRRGRGFSYVDDDGTPVDDSETTGRIKDLAIPPAWRKVWICPHPNALSQRAATGVSRRWRVARVAFR